MGVKFIEDITKSVREFYSNGHSIRDIMNRLDLSECFIYELLASFKDRDVFNKRIYCYNFKELIVNRVLSGVNRYDITKEIGIAHITINKFFEEFDIDIPTSQKSLIDSMYEKIKWRSFYICPSCHGDNVNDLNIHKEEGFDLNHSYCLDCGTEWEERKGKVYRINWEYVE